MKVVTKRTAPLYVCSNEKIKMFGTLQGMFPDYGHHLEDQMGGIWLYPVKLSDGFWMHFTDKSDKLVSTFMKADAFENYPYKNEFLYEHGLGHTAVHAKRKQYAPEGVKGFVIEYEFVNSGDRERECEIRFFCRMNLRPMWFSEKMDLRDGAEDLLVWKEENGCFEGKDSDHPWYCLVDAAQGFDRKEIGQMETGDVNKSHGPVCMIENTFVLQPGETGKFVYRIAGSEQSEEDALKQLSFLRENRDFEEEKRLYLEKLIGYTKLETPDENFCRIFDWVKVNNNWLILDQDRCGRGIVAGLPEYVWWFGCDSCYTLQGILGLGDRKLCRDTLELLLCWSEKWNGNGRILHEILPNEYCPNQGNTQETAHFVTMVWKYYEWTGDAEFLKSCMPYFEKSVEWLESMDEDQDGFPGGYGITEIAGLNMEMLDTAVYTGEAYECYAKMLELFGEPEKADKWRRLSCFVKDQINERLWDDRAGLYCDACTSYAVLQTKEKLLRRFTKQGRRREVTSYMEQLLEERKNDGTKERGWLLNRNWPITIPMETGIAPKDRAARALKQLSSPDFVGEYGVCLDSMNHDAMMTISTGVTAVSLARYGFCDEALELIEKMFSTFSAATPGTIYEMSPDYGCFVQAWTSYGAVVPVISYFLGIHPSASEHVIHLSPALPSKWDRISADRVRLLDGELSFSVRKTETGLEVKAENTTSYPLSLEYPEPEDGKKAIVSGVYTERSFTAEIRRSIL